MKPHRFLPVLALTALLALPCTPVPAEASFAGLPGSFKIGPMGDLTCVGMTEDACAYFDEVPTPSGVRYLVQGSFSRPRPVTCQFEQRSKHEHLLRAPL